MNIFNKNNNDSTPLRIMTLGGTEKVNKNLTLYEYGDEMIVVDCGIGFPDIFDMPGVDVLIPDFTYLLENIHKLKGVFITHGHEDHVGAVPYLLQEVDKLDVYSTKLVQEFLKVKLSEKKYKNSVEKIAYHIVNPDGGEIDLGNFKISAIRVNHSIPEAVGYAIRTPQGLIMHMAEYKFDPTPVLDKTIDVEKIKRFSKEGVLCLLSDSLLITTDGSTASEKTLENTFYELFKKAGGRQILVTTMSSNISRMYQIIVAALKYDRKVVPSGRSVEQMVEVARRLGYLPNADDVFVSEQEAGKYDQSQLVYLIAGCYGQPGSSLERLSRGEHESITLDEDAMVVFSGDPAPPGSDIMVDKVSDALTLAGAEVITSQIQDNLHVSGHGTRNDLKRMAELVNPKYFIPLGSSITKMRAYTNMVPEIGKDKKSVFECLEGDSVDFVNGEAKKGPTIETNPVYIDGRGMTKINARVVKDRELLCDDGVFIVIVPKTSNDKILFDKVDVITRGFVYVKDSHDLMQKSKHYISKHLQKNAVRAKDWNSYKRKLESDVVRFLRKEKFMKPMVIVHSINI